MARFTVSVPDRAVVLLEELRRRWGTTRSGVVVRLLRWYEEHEVEQLMVEGYQVMAEENLREAEAAMGAQAEVVLRDSAR